MLDEPTNHLDSQMSDWLEEYLNRFRGTLLMVTHDRYFLDRVADRILEVDQGKVYSCPGSYHMYVERKEERLDMARASERKRQSILRTELQWLARGARARSTKQKARIPEDPGHAGRGSSRGTGQSGTVLPCFPAGAQDSGTEGNLQEL